MSHSWQVVWLKYELNWSFGQGFGLSAAKPHLWPAKIKQVVVEKWGHINLIDTLEKKYSNLLPSPNRQHRCSRKWENSRGQSLQVYFVVISNSVSANVIFSAPLTSLTNWPRGHGYGRRPGIQTWPVGQKEQDFDSKFEAPEGQVLIAFSEHSKPGGHPVKHDQS